MVKEYENLRVPSEFKRWLEQRQKVISRVHSNMLNKKKKLTLARTMRILSKINGITCDQRIMKELLSKEFKKR